jgi:CheY-like chemotaxis protein
MERGDRLDFEEAKWPPDSDPAAREPSPSENGRELRSVGDDGDRIRVLVVDDEPSLRLLLRRVLEDAGLEVFEASNGAAALVEVAARRPVLVVTDVMMPVMNGRELIERLRSDPATASILIVVASAETGIASLPVDAAVPKPFRTDVVLDTVRRLIGAVA